ncbi:protein tramtrack, alpha isoform isoform X1 [Drosophila guanche]|uniref:protein tramtrack, alpha isoform isoform X1 n=1 Tax=Drosophila guanche TaxID=7266 RepID=UPI001471CE10|nr:protein tramtrack, alpha isoform isoform X1 [Drosophila guanche]
MQPQQYCLRWKYHHSNLQMMFSQLLDRGCFCDVTLACEGQMIRAHRVVLCACSTFFDSVLTSYASERDPIIIMKDVTFAEVKCLIEFMYKGEINVEHASLPSLLRTADELKIKGLAEVSWRDDEDGPPPPIPAAVFLSPPRSLAESYAQDMLHHQQQQQQQQQAAPQATLQTERDLHDREPSMESVLGRMPTKTPQPGTGTGAGTGAGASSELQAAVAPVEHFMGPKRKRGRPPLDDAYDVFNVRKLAHYAASLEPAQRAYLESGRHFAEEPFQQIAPHSSTLASLPASITTSSLLPKQRQRHRHHQQQQQQQQQQTQQLQAGASEQDSDAADGRANGLQRGSSTPKPSDGSEAAAKQVLEARNDQVDHQVLGTSTKKLEKISERRERHGKLRHARRHYVGGEPEKPSEKRHSEESSSQRQSGASGLPQPVEEIENEHLVANRAESPAARCPSALVPASFSRKYESGVGVGGAAAGASTGAGPGTGGYLINEHGLLMPHEFSPNVASAAAAAVAASASASANASNGNHSQVGEQGELEDYDAAELRLTNEELSEWQDVIKMDDYLAKGRRPQFWEEPFTKRVLDAIKNKRLEMKKAARILGVSYGTLYGRYREVYGCLKHPYSSALLSTLPHSFTNFRNFGPSPSVAGGPLAVGQPRFDLNLRPGAAQPSQLGDCCTYFAELGKLKKDLSELWTRPQI